MSNSVLEKTNEEELEILPYLSQFQALDFIVLEGDISSRGKARHHLFAPNEYSCIEAEYENGVMKGEFSIFNKQGIKIITHGIENNKREGLYVKYDNLGNTLAEIQYKNDKKHGVGKFYVNNHLSYLIVYDNNRQILKLKSNGKFMDELDESGTVIGKGIYNDQYQRNGIHYEYTDNKLSAIHKYSKGQLICTTHTFENGEMTELDEQGSVKYKGGYEDNMEKNYPRSGKGEEYEEGMIVYMGEYKMNCREGKGSYFVDGTCRYEGEWKQNSPFGKGAYYDEKGDKLYEGDWMYGYHNCGFNKWIDYLTGETESVKDKGLLSHWKERGGRMNLNAYIQKHPVKFVFIYVGILLAIFFISLFIVYAIQLISVYSIERNGIYTVGSVAELREVRTKSNVKELTLAGRFDDYAEGIIIENLPIEKLTFDYGQANSIHVNNLPNLTTLIFESYGFDDSEGVLSLSNLPLVKEIELVSFGDFSSLVISNCDSLETLIIDKSFKKAKRFYLGCKTERVHVIIDLPSLKSLDLCNSFTNIQEFTLTSNSCWDSSTDLPKLSYLEIISGAKGDKSKTIEKDNYNNLITMKGKSTINIFMRSSELKRNQV